MHHLKMEKQTYQDMADLSKLTGWATRVSVDKTTISCTLYRPCLYTEMLEERLLQPM